MGYLTVKAFKEAVKRSTRYVVESFVGLVAGRGMSLFDHFHRSDIMRYSAKYIRTNKIKGDYLHFGVGSGEDFISSYKCFTLPVWCHFYLFDSFKGLPAPEDDFNGKYGKGKYTFPKDTLMGRIRKKRIPEAHYTIIEGYFDDILTKGLNNTILLEKASIVVLDCDLYESTVSAIKVMQPYIQPGTLLLAGEYFNYGGDIRRGMAKALFEYQNDPKNDFILNEWRPYGMSGKAFILQKR